LLGAEIVSLVLLRFVVWLLDRFILFCCSPDILIGCLVFFLVAGFVDSVGLVSWLMGWFFLVRFLVWLLDSFHSLLAWLLGLFLLVLLLIWFVDFVHLVLYFLFSLGLLVARFIGFWLVGLFAGSPCFLVSFVGWII
jgi:hypothetical protein